MENKGAVRHQFVERLTAQHYADDACAAISLWNQLATQVIAIVGVGGFDALYARSVLLTQSKFPWLTDSVPSVSTDHRFAHLKASLEGQTPEFAWQANRLLLVNFSNTMVSLIGESLTVNILDTASGSTASSTLGKGV